MAFCANCGSEVQGQFCPKCGTRLAVAAPLGGPSPGAPGLTSNLASALCYIPLVAIVFLLIEPYNKDREVRFHAWQSIFVLIAFVILRFIIGQLNFVSFGLVSALAGLIGIGELVLIIFLAFKAYNNQRIVLPVIGPLAEKQV